MNKNIGLTSQDLRKFGFKMSLYNFTFGEHIPFVLSSDAPSHEWNLKSEKNYNIWCWCYHTCTKTDISKISVKLILNGKVIRDSVNDICGQACKKSNLHQHLFLENSIIRAERIDFCTDQKIQISLLNPTEIIKPIKVIFLYSVSIQYPGVDSYYFNTDSTHDYLETIRCEFTATDKIYFSAIPSISEGIIIDSIHWKSSSFCDHVSLGSDDLEITFSYQDFRLSGTSKYSKKWCRLDFHLHPLILQKNHYLKFHKIMNHIALYLLKEANLPAPPNI